MSFLVSLARYLIEIDFEHCALSTSSRGVAPYAELDADHSTQNEPPSCVLPLDREGVEQEGVHCNM